MKLATTKIRLPVFEIVDQTLLPSFRITAHPWMQSADRCDEYDHFSVRNMGGAVQFSAHCSVTAGVSNLVFFLKRKQECIRETKIAKSKMKKVEPQE